MLGVFIPSRLQSEIIEAELPKTNLLPNCCSRERISVRVPDPRVTAHPDNLQWHQDGGGVKGTTRHLVVWATEQPTEIQLPDGEVFIGKPYELIWFDNDVVFHKQPTGTDEGTRWFVAVRCSGAT